MIKKLSYRRSKKGVSEQYSINISKEFINELGITPQKREVEIICDLQNKEIIIKAKEYKWKVKFYFSVIEEIKKESYNSPFL
mgnify:CR=1 FL=1